MANWWDSYMTDTPSYLDPNLTDFSSPSTQIDLSNSSPQTSWWDSVAAYNENPTINWWDTPQYNTNVTTDTPSTGNWWDSVPSFLSSGAGALLSGGAQLAGGLLSGMPPKEQRKRVRMPNCRQHGLPPMPLNSGLLV